MRSQQRRFISFFFLLQDDQTPLHLAAWFGYTEIVTKLLESGADHGVKDEVWSVLFNKCETYLMN